MNSWFEQESGILNLDEIVMKSETFRKIMADEIVTEEEVKEQSHLLLNLLKELDENLDPEMRKLVGRALTELAVLFAVSHFAACSKNTKSEL